MRRFNNQIGEAGVEVRDQPIEILGEFRGLQAGTKAVQEGAGLRSTTPPARHDLPREPGQLKPSKGQRTTYRRSQHRLAAEIEKPLAGVALPQPGVGRVAFSEDRLEKPRHCDQKSGLVGMPEP